MSHPFRNQPPHQQYLSLEELQQKYQVYQSKHDLFYNLLNQSTHYADAQSNAKVQQSQEQVMIAQAASQHHGCRCSKIGCLKLYCECFANGRKCGGNCECTCCHNKPENQSQILQAKMLANFRHPGHFKGVPALIPARRCTCKKSMCQKRYCECYSAGLKCTQFCECKDCQNGQPHEHHEQDYFQNLNDNTIQIQVQA